MASPQQTTAERTNFEQTSRYEDVVAFLKAAAQSNPRLVKYTTFGFTTEGRPLPLAVVGRVADAKPETVKASGKLRVYIQANVHGGEVEGKESTQALVREIAKGKYEEWLDSMVLLIAPIYNADGNEKVSLNNRGPQHGLIGGMGTRANAQGLNINRDYMKLETPEARSMVKLQNEYDPHVMMDLHTTDGSRHAYHLTYETPKIAEDSDSRSIVGQQLSLRSKIKRADQKVEILMGETEDDINPYTGRVMLRRRGVRKPEQMWNDATFESTETERVPAAYYVPAEPRVVLERLRAHGIKMDQLTEPATLQLEEFQIASSEATPQAFENHRERTVAGKYAPIERVIPAGTWRIPMNQPLSRLAFYLLEPRSNDGLLTWNFLDDALKDSRYPIVRTRN